MKKFSLILFAALTTLLSAYGQGARNIKINEVMTSNKASITDEYGRHKPWVELQTSHTLPTTSVACISLRTGKCWTSR